MLRHHDNCYPSLGLEGEVAEEGLEYQFGIHRYLKWNQIHYQSLNRKPGSWKSVHTDTLAPQRDLGERVHKKEAQIRRPFQPVGKRMKINQHVLNYFD